MNLFTRAKATLNTGSTGNAGSGTVLVQSARTSATDFGLHAPAVPFGERQLYDGLRQAVPVIDAAIGKLVRLTGGFRVICGDEAMQRELDEFAATVKVGLTGQSLESFLAAYLDSLLMYGNAAGEILVNRATMQVAGLYNADVGDLEVRAGKTPIDAQYYTRAGMDGISRTKVRYPQLILFTALNPCGGSPYGTSILRGLPFLSGILMRIYESIGQNFDRVGNIRYAVTYKPTADAGDRAYAKERAMQIAKEWSEGMAASASGQIRDFIAVGDVDIKVIGAENQLMDTNIPVRQLLEQIVAKLGIPPFLLGLSWSSTERMSKQQADILTSELEHYRRLLTPVILQICRAFLSLRGCAAAVRIEWQNINLQDEVELAHARLYAAQATLLESRQLESRQSE